MAYMTGNNLISIRAVGLRDRLYVLVAVPRSESLHLLTNLVRENIIDSDTYETHQREKAYGELAKLLDQEARSYLPAMI